MAKEITDKVEASITNPILRHQDGVRMKKKDGPRQCVDQGVVLVAVVEQRDRTNASTPMTMANMITERLREIVVDG